ncbi:cytochrome c oxidase assembly protein [Colletotrichum sojae]|uniref:Cytochrome c oxidase assembly protein n=1 Tax=Colletotrichum sojae TaxID=2175907 RepID=A0A8H6MID8_9PEZI|nr:cytochrome c oxidase assembly protein [Colletotrichum sojae]
MSRASKLTLAATSLFAASTIVIVHFQQKFEKEACRTIPLSLAGEVTATAVTERSHPQAMHQGVIRDMELQRIKRERQLDFDIQRTLEEEYKREQTVRESPTPDSAPIGGRENQGRAQ